MFERHRRVIDLRTPYEKFVDNFFLFIIMLLPFERAFITERGSGAFLQYVIICFFVVSLPLCKRYYSKWTLGIFSYLIFLIIGTISDSYTFEVFNMFFLYVETRVWIVFYLFLVAYNLSRRDEFFVKKIASCLLFFSLTVAVFQILNIGVSELEEGGVEGMRMEVMGQNLNATARDLMLYIFFAFLVFLRGIKCSNWMRYIVIILSGVSFAALLRTGSRGGLLSLLCAMPIVLFTTKKMSKKICYIVVLSFVLIVMILVVLQSNMIMDRLNKAYYDGDTGGREKMFYLTLELWTKAKFFGYGCVAYKFIIGPLAKFGEQMASHCTYTYAYLAGGLVGAFFYYFSLINILINAIKVRFLPYGNWLLMCVVAALLGGITMNIEYTKWLYIIYGLVLGTADLKRRNRFGNSQISILR